MTAECSNCWMTRGTCGADALSLRAQRSPSVLRRASGNQPPKILAVGLAYTFFVKQEAAYHQRLYRLNSKKGARRHKIVG
jgi:hypothetical protein